MIDTEYVVTTIYKPYAVLGEKLKEECPQNDCIVYLNIYGMLCDQIVDYKMILELPGVSEITLITLRRGILEYQRKLRELYHDNYAVKKYRESVGM